MRARTDDKRRGYAFAASCVFSLCMSASKAELGAVCAKMPMR